MSLTKRYLDSLSADEQDAILGGIDNAYISPDEWVNDAENEPTDEESAEWARALMEEEIERDTFIEFLVDAIDGATGEGPISLHVRGSLALLTELRNYSDDGPIYEARYYHKLASWPVADKFKERDEAPLVKPEPKRVDYDGWSI